MQDRNPLPAGSSVSRIDTPGFAGHNVAWSPFFPDRLAVAGAANVRTTFRSEAIRGP